jgi:(R,R)-butanediol dehydrogenase/meso-butanediol dehydrogenase/diacetyl reductase
VTMWPRVISLIQSGKLPVEKIISGHIRAEDVVEQGFRRLLDPRGDQMKILVNLN